MTGRKDIGQVVKAMRYTLWNQRDGKKKKQECKRICIISTVKRRESPNSIDKVKL